MYDSLTPYLRGLVPYPRRAPAVRELDMITVSRQQWGGLATPPPLRLPASRLPGFPTVRRVSTDSYTVTRYLAPTPVRLRAASLAALDPGDELALQR